jgi:hypothetical protein
MDTDTQLAQYFAGMWPHLDEHARRLVAASKAVELGYGGVSLVSRACGLSWRTEGRRLYPGSRRLLITADAGGSNGWRLRLWKWELQGLADRTGLMLTVCHFPPGTSKWNKGEHRLFSFISSNWRGEPLRDYETAVRLIAGTTTAKGLTVTCRLDHRKYPVGRKITDDEFAHVNLKPDKFQGEWNYTIRPNN